MAHSNTCQTMKETADQLSSRACGAMNQAQDAASDWAQKAQNNLEALSKAANQYVEQGQQTAQKLGRTVSGKVQERPVAALLAAAGLGFLLAVIIHRR